MTEHSIDENRWADYKSSDSAFSARISKAVPQGFEKQSLTSEGKRQVCVKFPD